MSITENRAIGFMHLTIATISLIKRPSVMD